MDPLSFPEVLDDLRVHDTHPLARLLPGVCREVALGQDVSYHPVGFFQRRPGIIHEGPLDTLPSLLVALAALRGEGLHLILQPLPAFSEFLLSLALGASLLDGALVLGAELFTSPLLPFLLRSSPSGHEEGYESGNDDDRHHDDYHQRHVAHGVSSLGLLVLVAGYGTSGLLHPALDLAFHRDLLVDHIAERS